MNRESRAVWRGCLACGLVAIVLSVLVAGCSSPLRPAASRAVEILPPATQALPPEVTPSGEPASAAGDAAPLSPTPRPLRVDVAGAVVAPGVYRLEPDSIVADAIAAAGGPAADADLDRINKAAALLDGMQVYVPHVGRPTPDVPTPVLPTPASSAPGSGSRGAAVPLAGGAININTATQAELEALPGIGPALAERIIAGRPYRTVDGLLEVKGIGPAVFGRIRDLVAVQ